MISREMLYALLLGLPEKYFEHLDWPWPWVAKSIRIGLNQGLDPLSALKSGFARLGDQPLAKVKETLLSILLVMEIPGLSYRQREALVALRSVKAASLAQMCRILAQDRRNTYRRMNALVSKGLAFRFYQPGGVHYFAISTPMDRSLKHEINHFIDDLIKEFSAEAATQSTQPTQSTRQTLSP
ncbi:MAG: hypothetical protein M1347_06400 [Chloroflexi bacterium]|nr:hypothetical protein [Chloroflexota bacterium]